MGTVADQDQVERLHRELQSIGKELENIGHEHILMTVHQERSSVFGSDKGKLYLADHWEFVTEFVKFCEGYAVIKSKVVGAQSDTTVDDAYSASKNTTQSETNIDNLSCNNSSNTAKPLDNAEELFDCETDIEDVGNNEMLMNSNTDLNQTGSNTDEVNKPKQNDGTKNTTDKGTTMKTMKTRSKRKDSRVYIDVPKVDIVLRRVKNSGKEETVKKHGMERRTRFKDNVKESGQDKKTDRKRGIRSVKTEALATKKIIKELSCSLCHAKLMSPELLKSHLEIHDDLKCSFCRKECQSVSELNAHKKEHLDNETCYECKLCENKLYKFEWQLGQHMEKEHMDSSKVAEGHFPCLECGYVFQFQNHLDEHRQVMPNCRSEIPAKQKEEGFLESVFTFKDPQSGKVKTKTWRDLLAPDRKYPARCEICQKSMPIKCRYQRHVWTHADFKAHKCFICNKDFKFNEELHKHLKVHNQRPFHCEHCHFKFDTEARRDHHVKLTCTKLKDKPDLVCKVCGHQFNSVFKLKDHEMLHTGLTPWKCDQCSFSAPTKSKLTRHKRVDHKEVLPFKCEQCGLMFRENNSLLLHMKSHEEKKFECEVCGQKLANESNLKRHMQKTHREKRTFPCDQCGRVFYRPVRLQDHLRRHTGEKPYICETCGMSFYKKGRLTEHIRTHTGDKPFTCSYPDCGKKFSSFSGLRVHRKIHNPNRCFICDVCGRTFKNESHLQYHRKNHTLDWRWPCMYCEMKYKSLAMYKTHLAKVHPDQQEDIERRTPIRLHRCELCSKVYSDGTDLKRHILIHKGLKPFKCTYCDKTFNDKSNLRCHERVHTGDVRLRCNYCSKGFIHPRALRLHLSKVHGQTMNKPAYPEDQESYSSTQESTSAVDVMLEDQADGSGQRQQQQQDMVAEPLNQSMGFQNFKTTVHFTLDQQAVITEPIHQTLGFQRYKDGNVFSAPPPT